MDEQFSLLSNHLWQSVTGGRLSVNGEWGQMIAENAGLRTRST